MHRYRYPAHDRRAGEMAREVAFSQASLRHQVSPLAKLVAQGESSVVDAYVSPVLRRYIDRAVADLAGAPATLCLVLLLTAVAIFRLIQLILIVELKLLGDFGVLVGRAHGCLILTCMLIVPIVVVILGTARRVHGENQSMKLAQTG